MEKIRQVLKQVVYALYGVEIEADVTVAPEGTGADYATNLAMRLAKVVHKAPMVIAEEVANEFSERISSAEPASEAVRVEVAAPGFLNFISPDEYFLEKVGEIAGGVGGFLGCDIAQDEYSGKTVVVEFSDPNPFKVLHVGHLYTSVVGDAISRILELAGAKVVRANFGGDVGLHVGKTLWALNLSFSRVSSLEPASAPSPDAKSGSVRSSALPRTSLKNTAFKTFLDGMTIEDIAKAYVEGTRAYEEDEKAKAEIVALNKEIYRINAEDDHEGRIAELYWRGRELSYQYFEDFYAKIGVKFDKYYPESTVAGRGLKEVREHTGSVYEESEGAVVYHGEKLGLHTRVFINREGVPTYEAKDVGLIFTKWDDWHFDESVVVTGNEQTEYMKVVLASVAEYAPRLVERTVHLTHGLVKLPGSVKMSSRKGNFLKAVDVLKLVEATLLEASSSTGALLTHRTSSTARSATPVSSNSPNTEASQDVSLITLAAIKYAFLKYKMGGDIVFDPKESVSTTGNSGVYLLYSAVRAKKILQRAGSSSPSVQGAGGRGSSKDSPSSSLKRDSALQDGETAADACHVAVANLGASSSVRGLSKKIVQYKEIMQGAVAEKAPNKICTYLYELAQEFSRFYENVKVAGSEHEGELLVVVRAYLNVIEHGLGLLGIEIPEEM